MRKKARKPSARKGNKTKPSGLARSIGQAIGSALGSRFGPAGAVVGGSLGSAAGSLFKTVTGFGDYKVRSNSLTLGGDSLPRFLRNGQGFRITHREYLQDVVTSDVAGQFKLESFLMQPGLRATFPWLAAIAVQFEEYKIHGAVWDFKSNSLDAVASTNSAAGTVIMTTQYNVLNPPFVNKQQMEQYDFTCSTKPSMDLLHPVECDRSQSIVSVLNTRDHPVVEGDQRLYDFARFNIATVGTQGASTNIGELWITYDIEFLKPKLGDAVDVYDHYYTLPEDTTTMYWDQQFSHLQKTAGSNMGTTLVSTGPDTDIYFPPTFTGNVFVTSNYTFGATDVGGFHTLPLWTAVGSNTIAYDAWPYNGNSLRTGAGLFPHTQNYSASSTFAFSVVNGGRIHCTLTNSGSLGSLGSDLIVYTIPDVEL